ncbi:MAG: hypothetical protein HC906_11775 [Bacteroidales bacterium]|nr:hypothetical protein [Bacteroidales bacterium]
MQQLGFKDYLKAVHERDTDALLELLGNIEKNMSDEIKNELIRNTGDSAFIDRIILFASKIKKANLSQRSLMATKKAIEQDARKIFEQLLYKVYRLCQDTYDYYLEHNAEKAKMFNHAYTLEKYISQPVISN